MAPLIPRGPNFTTIEDLTMCKIHLSISQDPVVGTDQSEAELWTRIVHDIEHILPNKPKRTWGSWKKRYQTISKEVLLFAAKVVEIEGEHHTGWGPERTLEEARLRFKDCNDGKPFKHVECYPILLDNIKYNRRSTFVFDTTHDEENYYNDEEDGQGNDEGTQAKCSNHSEIGDIEKRQRGKYLGKKEAKRLKKNGRNKSTSQEEMMEKLIQEQQHFNAHYEAQSKFKMEQRAAEFAAKQAEWAAKQAKQAADDELRIMMTDLDKLDPLHREYFELLKTDIVRNKRNQF